MAIDIKYCPACGKEQLLVRRQGRVETGDWLSDEDGYENEHDVYEYGCLDCETIFYV